MYIKYVNIEGVLVSVFNHCSNCTYICIMNMNILNVNFLVYKCNEGGRGCIFIETEYQYSKKF